MSTNATVLLGRILLSLVFIVTGFAKLTDLGGTTAYFAMLQIPAPNIMAILAGLFELIGGIFILLGFQTRITAWLMALFCIATALVAHRNFADQMQLINFEKNVVMAGGFLVLAAFGDGAFSVDAKWSRAQVDAL